MRTHPNTPRNRTRSEEGRVTQVRTGELGSVVGLRSCVVVTVAGVRGAIVAVESDRTVRLGHWFVKFRSARGRRRSRRCSDSRLGGSVQPAARVANTLSRIVEPGEVGVSGRRAVLLHGVVGSQRERHGILGGFALLLPPPLYSPLVRTDANFRLAIPT
jgi:hypothetical protein